MTDTVEIENDTETEEPEITTNDVIKSMVNSIVNGDNINAQNAFGALMSVKIADAIDNKKLDLSQSIYSRED